MRKRILSLIVLGVLLFAFGCHSKSVEKNTNQIEVAEDSYKQIIPTNNKLGFQLIDKVEANEDQNIFISPTSAMIALLFALNGTDGETKEEIIQALDLSTMEIGEINSAILSLVNLLEKETESTKLTLANSIWLNDKYHFKDEFSQIANDYFKAETSKISVGDQASVDKMNDWVSQATNNKITDIVQGPLHPNFVAMLINAIYFKGKWQYQFDNNTEELPFFTNDTEILVPFMQLKEEELDYINNEIFQAVKLPYASQDVSMQLFLPNEDVQLEDFLEQLTIDNWDIWNTEYKKTTGTIKMPKFKLEYETVLNDALRQLGMELAFNENEAEFPNMINEEEQLWISEVKQKAYIEVDEEGSEAAATTTVEIQTTAAVIDEDNFYMEFNRPFFFTIIDEKTNAILFMGIVSSPE